MLAPRTGTVSLCLFLLQLTASSALASSHCVSYGDFIHWMDSTEMSGGAADVAISRPRAPFVMRDAVDVVDAAVLDGQHEVRGYVATRGAHGVGLDVLDIDVWGTDPPEILGSVDFGGPAYVDGLRVAASGPYAYVATYRYDDEGGSFRVVDATDPVHPAFVADLAITGDTFSVASSGEYVYLAEGHGYKGVEVVDVSDPWRPRVVGGVATPGDAYGIAVSGNRAYVSVLDWHYPYTGRLQVIDISDPATPRLLGAVVMPKVPPDYEYSVGPVAVSGRVAYVAAGGGHWIYAVDVLDPRHPRIVGRRFLGSWVFPNRMAVWREYLHVSGSPYQVFDISQPERLRLVGGVDLGLGGGKGLAIAGETAYTTDGGVLQRIAISNPKSPPFVGQVNTPGQARDVAVHGHFAYVADWPEELQVIYTARPDDPMIVGNLAITGTVSRVAARGSLVYVALRNNGPWGPPGGLAVIDVRNPRLPRQLGAVDIGHVSRGLAVAGSYAYISGDTGTTGGLSVIDIRDPHNPGVVGSVTSPEIAYGLAVSKSHAFVAVRSAYPYVYGLKVFDVSTPALPFPVGSVDLPYGAYSVVLSGDHAFVLGFYLQVVDVSNPLAPRFVDVAYAPGATGNFGGVAIRGDVAYVSKDRSIEVFDVLNAAAPRFVGSVPSGGGGLEISDHLYVGSMGDGLLVLPRHCQPGPVR